LKRHLRPYHPGPFCQVFDYAGLDLYRGTGMVCTGIQIMNPDKKWCEQLRTFLKTGIGGLFLTLYRISLCCRKFFRQIVAAVAYIHEAGL
jgi:hypothetical protein